MRRLCTFLLVAAALLFGVISAVRAEGTTLNIPLVMGPRESAPVATIPAPPVSDTRLIAFTVEDNPNGNRDIAVVHADGTGFRRVTDTPVFQEENPVWSSDGHLIAFQRHGTLYVMRPDGTGEYWLTPDFVQSLEPAWHPNGDSIVFNAPDGWTDHLYVADVSGANPTLMTTQRAWEPVWSPDGSKLAYQVYAVQSGGHVDFEIYTMNADGSEQQNVSNNDEWDYSPRWSPDGAKLLFWSIRSGNSEVYVMDADGASVQRLTYHPLNDRFPTWSQDGQRIFFSSERDGNFEIYSMDPNGSNLRNETNHPADDLGFALSPDGRSMAFLSNRVGGLEIYVKDFASGGVTRITSNEWTETTLAWRP